MTNDNTQDLAVAPEPQALVYVTYESDGKLDGCYHQVPPEEHQSRLIVVSDEIRPNWCAYRANAARTGLELSPPPLPTPPTESEAAEAVQRYLDSIAVSFGYDSILNAISYADEPSVPQYQTEGQELRAWRSQVWSAHNQILADVKAEKRSIPTIEQEIAELPAAPVKKS